jgi:hypothetical protein
MHAAVSIEKVMMRMFGVNARIGDLGDDSSRKGTYETEREFEASV